MKALTASEFAEFISTLKRVQGARFQGVVTSERDIAFELYKDGQTHILFIDLATPFCGLFARNPVSVKKQTTPLLLFLRAHFIGRRISDISYDASVGRVFKLSFDNGDQIEIRLFRGGQNIIATSDGKSLAWRKPRDLEAFTQPEEGSEQNELQRPHRTFADIQEEWLNLRRPPRPKTDLVKGDSGATQAHALGDTAHSGRQLSSVQTPQEKELAKKRAKTESLIGRLKVEAQQLVTNEWRTHGETLKVEGFEGLPQNILVLLQKNFGCDSFGLMPNGRSVRGEAVQDCFARAKKIEAKRAGLEKRILELEAELTGSHLPTSTSTSTSTLKKSQKAPAKDLLKLTGAQGRKRSWQDLELYFGKHARDNLALLRKAQGWDYWLHLRDHPGAHAIVRRSRTRELSTHEWERIGNWLIELTFPQEKWPQLRNEKIEIVAAECRFVRPIKGDKLGRVTYQNPKHYVVTFQPVSPGKS